MAEEYIQKKYWPTRRIHLYEPNGDGYALCGAAHVGATYQNFPPFRWTVKGTGRHPFDDLNFCQSCRRVAESRHGRKQVTLTEYYRQTIELMGEKK